MARRKRSFGGLRKLPSGRWQANYTGPDGALHKAPTTFALAQDAEAWLVDRRREIDREQWSPESGRSAPAVAVVTFREFAATWLERAGPSDRPLKPRTRQHYAALLDQHVLPAFGDLALTAVTAEDVARWHREDNWRRTPRKGTTGRPSTTSLSPALTLRAHCYGLVRSIFTAAVAQGLVTASPCVIPGAGSAKRVHRIRPASLPEIGAVTAAMPERLQALVLLSAWCGLRFGESTELRRRDVDLKRGVLTVDRGVVRVEGGFVIGTPKSEAGKREVSVPPHLLPMLTEHLRRHVGPNRDSLVFPADHGGHLAPSTLYRHFYAARAKAGRPDLRWHDLRHTGAVLAASTGATLAELMARLGHSTPQAALRYQHAAQGRDHEIAAALSRLVAYQVEPPAT